jgi:hypothetical protein
LRKNLHWNYSRLKPLRLRTRYRQILECALDRMAIASAGGLRRAVRELVRSRQQDSTERFAD